MAKAKPVVIAIIANAKQASAVFKKTAGEAKSWGAKIGGVIKNIAKVGLGAGLGLIGLSLKKGFDRLNNIDVAKTKLKALGFTAKQTKSMMDSALKSVKGTAFGLDEAATVAASSAAATVKQGAAMDRHLKMIADTAAVTGRSMTDIGAIVNKVQTAQRVSQRELNQLNDAGVGISAELAKHYGVSAIELRKMVSAGKVDAKTFNKVLAGMTDDAAKTMGQTLPAKIANMGAALGRIGAKFLESIFPVMKGGADKILGVLDKLEDNATKMAEKVSKSLEGIVNWFKETDFTPLIDKLIELKDKALDAINGIQNSLEPLAKSFQNIWTLIGPVVELVAKLVIGAGWLALSTALELIGRFAAPIANRLEKITGWAAKHSSKLKAAAAVIGTILLPAMLSLAATAAVQAAQVIAMTAAWVAYGVVSKGMAIATKIATAAQWLFNAAMLANPITWVIIGVVALIAAIVLLVKNWDTVVEALGKAWDFLKTVFKAGVDYAINKVKDLWANAKAWMSKLKTTLGDAMKAGWQAAKDKAIERVNNIIDWVKKIPTRIKNAFGNVKNLLSGVGKQIMDSLKAGVEAKWESVKNKFNKLTDMIPSWKGPAAKDKKLLKPAATMIMDGLINQIDARRNKLKNKLQQVTRDIANFGGTSPRLDGRFEITSSGAAAAQPGTVNITVNVPVGANKAEIGREIAGALDAYYRIGGRR